MKSHSVLCAGVDEAGRGPLAGPVVVAAVILDPERPIHGLADSKKLSETRRNKLATAIRYQALAWRVEAIEVATIDEINILQATMLGMRLVVEKLDPVPELALIDGNRAPDLSCECHTIVRGDESEPAISAASILAKVHRDEIMKGLHQEFPHYGFDRHKGYPTRHHLQMLKEFGVCPHHRRSYAPVREALAR
ncbi:MAG TPA: ribonuclease HII [Xanthomonadales bacterium]|nr:ribonuclease HII [Xanthomonadales bacterium]